jgi:hypothetical protein
MRQGQLTGQTPAQRSAPPSTTGGMGTPILGTNIVGGAAGAIAKGAEDAANAVGGAIGSVLSPFEGVAKFFKALTKFFKALTKASTWINVAKVLAGIILITVSILELSSVRV